MIQPYGTMPQPHSHPTDVQLEARATLGASPVHVRVWMNGSMPRGGHVEVTYRSEWPGRLLDRGTVNLQPTGSAAVQIAPGEVTIRAHYVPAPGSVWMASTAATRRLTLV